MNPWPLLLLSGCSVAVLGDASDNCQRYQAAQEEWMRGCGIPAGGGTDCSKVMWFDSESEVDDCIAQVMATPCGQPTPDPCGGLIVKRPW